MLASPGSAARGNPFGEAVPPAIRQRLLQRNPRPAWLTALLDYPLLRSQDLEWRRRNGASGQDETRGEGNEHEGARHTGEDDRVDVTRRKVCN